MEAYDHDPHNVLLVGKTGKGKSRIVEILCNMNGISHRGMKSCTAKITAYETNSDPMFRVIDTPGFGDTEGRDGIFIAQWANYLRKLEHGLVLVVYVKSIRDRFDAQEQKNVQLLNEMFEEKLFTNFVVCLTNADLESHEDAESSVKEHEEALPKIKIPVILWLGKEVMQKGGIRRFSLRKLRKLISGGIVW